MFAFYVLYKVCLDEDMYILILCLCNKVWDKAKETTEGLSDHGNQVQNAKEVRRLSCRVVKSDFLFFFFFF